MMRADHVRGFVDAMEKQALSAKLLARWAAARAKQGVGGARQLASRLSKAPAGATSRQLAQKGGFTGHLMQATREGGQLATKTRVAPQRLGIAKQTQATRQRVAKAIQEEAAGKATRTNVPLSKAYEGYMTSAQTRYTPEHMAQVMGVKPSQVRLKAGPSQYQQQLGTAATMPGHAAPSARGTSIRVGAQRVATPEASAVTSVARAPSRTAGTAVAKRPGPAVAPTQIARPPAQPVQPGSTRVLPRGQLPTPARPAGGPAVPPAPSQGALSLMRRRAAVPRAPARRVPKTQIMPSVGSTQVIRRPAA